MPDAGNSMHGTADMARFSRQVLLPAWQQSALTAARVLVVGAGALGNEILKNLALAGVGALDILDFDRVETSNLSRCVLFREDDLYANKAEAVTRALQAMCPGLQARAHALDVRQQVGAGFLQNFSAVVGAVDTIEARRALNRLTREAAVPYFDAGMGASGGQVSYFAPNRGPCYECGVTPAMRERAEQSYSCLRQGSGAAPAAAPMAATITIASTLGAIAAHEVLRWLMRQDDGAADIMQPGECIAMHTQPYAAERLFLQQRPDCVHHDVLPAPLRIATTPEHITVAALLEQTGMQELTLAWEVSSALQCFDCCEESVALHTWALTQQVVRCPRCGRIRVPDLQSTVAAQDPLARCTLATLGVPANAVLTLRRHSDALQQTETVRVQLTSPTAGAQAGIAPIQAEVNA